MNNMLKGVDNVCVYLDDILISGADSNSHSATVNRVLSVLSKHGVRLRREKCKFGVSQVTHLGHMINIEGLHPLSEKITEVNRHLLLKILHNLSRSWVCYNSTIGVYPIYQH